MEDDLRVTINNTNDDLFIYDIESNEFVGNNKLKDNITKNNDVLQTLIPPKSILYNISGKTDDVTIIIIKILVTLFILCFTLPFIILDLYFAYNDKTCVNIYPNKLKISLSIYLQFNSYFLLLLLTIYSLLIFKKIRIYNYNEIIQTIINLFTIVIKVIIFGWNILGALIFWGDIAEKGDCSVILYNYLYATFIIRLLVISLILLNGKGSSIKHN
jgi:hypothetical protein